MIIFKKIILIFEDSELRVVTPIDPLEGQRYVEPVNNEEQGDYMDHIYNITSERDDYGNPTFDKNLSWHIISSSTSDLGEALESWQNRLHEVSIRAVGR